MQWSARWFVTRAEAMPFFGKDTSITRNGYRRCLKTHKYLCGMETLMCCFTLVCISIMSFIVVHFVTVSVWNQFDTVAIGYETPTTYGDASSHAINSPVSNETDDEYKRGNLTEVKGKADVVVFNRIPKCGSTELVELIRQLSPVNAFIMRSSKLAVKTFLTWREHEQTVNEVFIAPPPSFFERHVHFLDFGLFYKPWPVYISFIRDPLDRLVDECIERATDTCKVTTTAEYVTTIPFFCGNSEHCQTSNTYALYKAKLNVIKYYTVVGMAEETDKFLEVLEHLIPKFFVGANKLYLNGPSGSLPSLQTGDVAWNKFGFTNETIALLKNRLKLEYDFYNFIKQRFHQQYNETVRL